MQVRRMLVLAGLLLALGSVVDRDDSSRAGRATVYGAETSARELPRVDLDSIRFVRSVDNVWWPLARGGSWRYRRIAGAETTRVAVTVLRRRKTIRGISATCVRSVTFYNGRRTGTTRDWYAQDVEGNVWQLGSDGAAGSWAAGVDGARAGVVIPAQPTVGTSYAREHRTGEAERRGRIVSTDQAVQVPGGVFEHTLVVEKTTLGARAREHTILARGVGPVLVIDLSGRGGRVELVRFAPRSG